MVASFDFVVENEIKFQRDIAKLSRFTSDLRIPFRLIASDFYRSQRIIFNLKSPGLYNPLGGFNHSEVISESGETRRQRAVRLKQAEVGFAYPLLVGKTRNLSQSLLTRTHKQSHFVLNRAFMEIGSTNPYLKFHQSDKPRETLPQRKALFIDGGPKDASKSSRLTGRSERWTAIVADHIKQLETGRIL